MSMPTVKSAGPTVKSVGPTVKSTGPTVTVMVSLALPCTPRDAD